VRKVSPREGVCRLTGKCGRFVKSHIIPEALTRPPSGRPLAQAGLGKRPVKRWTSWYDTSLVTREGEDLLRNHDDWAIKILRRHKMTWRSWGGANALQDANWLDVGNGIHGFRKIELDTRRLRLFFLSLLWRTSATSLP
jgi:hypothetical protein